MKLDQITIRLTGQTLLNNLSVEVQPGEVLSVLGPSGSGKSTLLSYIAGFADPAFTVSGDVQLAGRRLTALPAHKRRIGLLFQDDLLLPHLTVAGNLAFGLPKARARSKTDRAAAVDAALKQAGLSGYGDRHPETLSGGQRARIALMRTLLSAPEALLLDEPFSKLDAELRQSFRAFVFEQIREARLPTLMVTHDLADAEAAGGRIIRLTGNADRGCSWTIS